MSRWVNGNEKKTTLFQSTLTWRERSNPPFLSQSPWLCSTSIKFQPDLLFTWFYFPALFCFASNCQCFLLCAQLNWARSMRQLEYFQFSVRKFVLVECLTSGTYLQEDVLSRARWRQQYAALSWLRDTCVVIITHNRWKKGQGKKHRWRKVFLFRTINFFMYSGWKRYNIRYTQICQYYYYYYNITINVAVWGRANFNYHTLYVLLFGSADVQHITDLQWNRKRKWRS